MLFEADERCTAKTWAAAAVNDRAAAEVPHVLSVNDMPAYARDAAAILFSMRVSYNCAWTRRGLQRLIACMPRLTSPSALAAFVGDVCSNAALRKCTGDAAYKALTVANRNVAYTLSLAPPYAPNPLAQRQRVRELGATQRGIADTIRRCNDAAELRQTACV